LEPWALRYGGFGITARPSEWYLATMNSSLSSVRPETTDITFGPESLQMNQFQVIAHKIQTSDFINLFLWP
jgi:hypothetical protein